MMKTKVEKVVAIGGGLVFLAGFLFCCSGIQFPFLSPKSSLNRHLNQDFHIVLPPSAVVEESFWVGSRDPEHVFKVQIALAEIIPFVENLRAAGNWEDETNLSRFGPLYRTPLWWNNPPLPDAQGMERILYTGKIADAHYRLLYSPSTGTTYWIWGGF
jgi:hypothetical protein